MLIGVEPVADDLFTWPAEKPRLIGSRCGGCGNVTFPRADACPGCGGTEMAPVLLGRQGTLWTWTVQRFSPPSPPYAGVDDGDPFIPYAVGYVELPGEVKVESRLQADPQGLRIGMPMELVIVPFRRAPAGLPVLTFAFRPVEDGS